MSLFSLCGTGLNIFWYKVASMLRNTMKSLSQLCFQTNLGGLSITRKSRKRTIQWLQLSSCTQKQPRISSQDFKGWLVSKHSLDVNQRHKRRMLVFHGAWPAEGLHYAARAGGKCQQQKGTVLTPVTNVVNTRSILMLSSSLDVFKQILIIFIVQRPPIYSRIVLRSKLT